VPLILLLLLGLLESPALEPIGRFDDPELREVSGIVRSRRHPGVFWVHNDSGNPPALFAVRSDGTVLRRFAVDARNIDWEDIAIDDSGHLYLGDIGNNFGALPVRVVYRLDEPDPARPPGGSLKPNLERHYLCSRDGLQDCEGLAFDGDDLLLLSKDRDGRESRVFGLPLDPKRRLVAPRLPDLMGTLPRFTEPATGADLTPDGRRLAVCGLAATRVYARAAPGRWDLLGEVRYPPTHQIESIAWDGDDLILASEEGRVFRIAAEAWRRGPRTERP
jgi:sugar lactone lactonase YvrE